jgi:[NiFe] hydrogenase assembly HybE family chaperone
MNAAANLTMSGRALEEVYTRIWHTRMRGLPIVNLALRVELVDLRAWNGCAVGVIVAPWCMNLVVLPLPGGCDIPAAPIGSVHVVQLPSGSFDLLAAYLPEIGHHLSGSLYSPMDAFISQEAAVTAARDAMALMFDVADFPAVPAKPAHPKPETTGIASRRSFLLGRSKR